MLVGETVKKRDASRLLRSERYQTFCETYRYDFLLFILYCFNDFPDPQQLPLIRDMSEVRFRVSAVSGHATGKTRLIAWYILWQILVFPKSTILLTSGKLQQMQDTLWTELTDQLEVLFSKLPWLEPFFVKQSKAFIAVGYKEGWGAYLRTVQPGKEGTIAGRHRRKHTVIVDEAAEVTDTLVQVLKGSLTDKDNSFAMFGQGLLDYGPFYDSHHKDRKLYSPHRLDSEMSPRVTMEWIEEKLDEYGGFLEDDYQIKVKGGFPTSSKGYLIPRAMAERCAEQEVRHDTPYGLVITADVAGAGRDDTVYLVAEVSGYYEQRKLRTRKLIVKKGVQHGPAIARDIKALYEKYKALHPTVGVDAGGGGHYVCGFLQEMGVPVRKIYWQRRAMNHERFGNQRAEWAWWVRNAVQYSNRLDFNGSEQPNKILEMIFDQFGKIPYRRSDRGIYLLQKDVMKSKFGIESPDIFDTYCFAMAMPYVSIDADGAEDFENAAARAEAEDYFSRLSEQFGDDMENGGDIEDSLPLAA